MSHRIRIRNENQNDYIGPKGSPGCRGPIGYTGYTGPIGYTGYTGYTGPIGFTGYTGPIGYTGYTGPIGFTGPYGTIGYAEYIHTIQTPNNSVPPGTAFTIDTLVFNNIPGFITTSPGAGGTVFTLQGGTYLIHYETSLASAGSIAIYTGPNAGSLAIDPNTISGSSTATTWIHGNAIEIGPIVFAISSVVGTASVTTSGTASTYMIRLIIIKIA